MERKKSVRVDHFYPLVTYMKGYLQKEKPGPDASKIRKDRYAMAVDCLRKMDGLLNEKNVAVGMYVLLRSCGGAGRYPIVPSSVSRLLK